jgi:TusA-related sulfurtransferase
MNRNLEAAAERRASQQFVELLAGRDFRRLAETLAPDARTRLLLPHGLEEHVGRDAIVGRIESWFGSASQFELVSSSAETVGARQRLSWRFSVVRGGGQREAIEQLVFLDHGPDGIGQMDVLCSGFQLDPDVAESATHVFDAGPMGCADGLAQEFRRRLNGVPVGDSICVVVRDPAAKEDLPALARMLGQSVTSTEAHEDGRLTINVERVK